MQVVISAPLEMFDVARYGWVAMIQHSELRRLPLFCEPLRNILDTGRTSSADPERPCLQKKEKICVEMSINDRPRELLVYIQTKLYTINRVYLSYQPLWIVSDLKRKQTLHACAGVHRPCLRHVSSVLQMRGNPS